MSGRKTYLGDGVYVDVDGWRILLTTENGITTTNLIVLEPPVLAAFLTYLSRLQHADEHP